jgi:hypothetical protein
VPTRLLSLGRGSRRACRLACREHGAVFRALSLGRGSRRACRLACREHGAVFAQLGLQLVAHRRAAPVPPVARPSPLGLAVCRDRGEDALENQGLALVPVAVCGGRDDNAQPSGI